MHKYITITNYLDFGRRRLFWLFRKIIHFTSDVRVAMNSDVSPFASLSALEGPIRIGAYSIVDRGAILRNHGGMLSIGQHCSIGPFCTIYSGGDLTIGNGVRIGPLTAIIAGNHRHDDRETFIYRQGMDQRGIKIEDDVWIGAGAKVLDGVTIGHGAIVAAGAVVTRPVGNYEVVAGIPARVVGVRGA